MRLSFALIAFFAVAACGAGPAAPYAYDGGYGVPYDGGPGAEAAEVPSPAALAEGLGAPVGLALIGATVYAADPADGAIVAVPLGGGAATVLATGLGHPTWLATDGTQLFASDVASGRLLAISTGGQVTPLVTGAGTPGRIVVASGTVYWIDEGAPNATGGVSDGTGAILSVPAAGGTPVTLASKLNTPHDLAIANGTIFFTEVGPPANCSTGANWEQIQTESRIATLPVAGGSAPATFAQQPPPFVTVQGGYLTPTGAGQARGLAVDPTGAWLFFTTRGICWPVAGNVYQTSTGASANLTTLSDAPPSSDRIEASATAVTWASQALLSQVPWGGAPAPYVNLASQTSPGDFLWSGSTVVWTDQETGDLYALTPGTG
jgi:hypothetical protein